MSKRAATILAGITALAVALWLAVTPLASVQSQSSAQDPKPQETLKQDIIKVETALVAVPVIVTDRYGRFVTGLERGDFLVREDGAPQEITNFASTETPFNVALLIDTSRSTQNKLGAIRKAALAFVKQLQPRDRVLIVSFDEQVRFHGDFTSDAKELQHQIGSVKSSYLTSLYDAIHRTITEKLLPLAGRKAIVVLTDGVDTASHQATYQSTLDLIASNGIISYTIQYDTRNDGSPLMSPGKFPPIIRSNFLVSSFNQSQQGQHQSPPRTEPPAEKEKPDIKIPLSIRSTLGAPPPSNLPPPTPTPQVKDQAQEPRRDPYLIAGNFLRSLAIQSGARYIRAENIENTPYAFALIANELRHQYTLAYYSSNEKRDGKYRAIEVLVKRQDVSARARQGYLAPKAVPPETEGKAPEKKPGEIK